MSLEHVSARNPDTMIVVPVPAARPLPSPEQVFADWLLWVPQGADLSAAAREQIASIDRRGSLHPGAQYLRTLLVAVAGGCPRRQTCL
jgi:hypothetical protein